MIQIFDSNNICECCGKYKLVYIIHFQAAHMMFKKILRICNDCFKEMNNTKKNFDHESKPDDFKGVEKCLVSQEKTG
jgi:hypothetical protein